MGTLNHIMLKRWKQHVYYEGWMFQKITENLLVQLLYIYFLIKIHIHGNQIYDVM